MTAKKQVSTVTEAADPSTVQGAIDITTRFVEEAAQSHAPTVSRAMTARNAAKLRTNELLREKADFEDRLELLKAQYNAATNALQAHCDDITEELQLISTGFGQVDGTGNE